MQVCARHKALRDRFFVKKNREREREREWKKRRKEEISDGGSVARHQVDREYRGCL